MPRRLPVFDHLLHFHCIQLGQRLKANDQVIPQGVKSFVPRSYR